MTLDQECLYMQYFYNAVIEFIYFTIIYIEGFGKANLNTLCKHVKFFKVEVGTFILSFHGETFEDKLYQMLNILGCFTLLGNKIYINESKSFKDTIFNDLVISKCVDLVLRGIDNIDAISENLNFNNVIYISKKNILDITEKSSYLSIRNKQGVLLHHIHGLLGFENNISSSVICYFYDVIYRNQVLSFNEIRDHSKFLSFCGIHNLIMIFSILNCSKQFECENGYVRLKKKFKKYPKSKTIDLELQEVKFTSQSMHVGQIVQSTYGPSLYKWTGEIGSLNESSGIIYCVVDFTNGYHGVFIVCFNETALKVISETNNLKKYLKIRDTVEFDAEYYIGKTSERCWRATRLKVLHSNKFEHDENLYDKLCYESESLKNQCCNNTCCLINTNLTCDNFISDNSLKFKSPKYSYEEKLAPENAKTSDIEFYNMDNSVNKLEIICKNDDKNCISDQKPSYDLHLSFSNLFNIDYSYMFGYVYMLMADKGIAIAEQGEEIYNIVFMKNSVYTDKFENLVNGQKVLVLIPYHGTLEPFCVSTLVYGLNEKETDETEKSNVHPKDFAMKIFADSVSENLQCKLCSNYNDVHQLLSKEEGFTTALKQRMELIELYESILKEYKVPFQNDYLLQFLFGLYKRNLKENFKKKVFHFIVKLSKSLKKHAVHKVKTKCERKLKMIKNSVKNHNLQFEVQVHDLCTSVSAMSLTDENSVSVESSLIPKSKYLDVATQSRTGTPSSFETCYSSDSDSFYSCESRCNSPNISSSPLLNKKDDIMQDLHNKTKINFQFDHGKQFQTQDNGKVHCLISESNPDISMKPQSKNLKHKLQYKNQSKYLSLKSVLVLKQSVKKRRKIVFPTILKSVCKNCFKSSVSLAAYISMISKSFFFYTLNINGYNVTLPLPKQVIPPDLQENMKLNSCGQLTVIPNVLANLSHIIVVNIFT